MKICGIVVCPPDRRVASARSAVPCPALISLTSTFLERSSCSARMQYGHQACV